EQAVGNLSDLQIKNYNTNLYNKNEGITFYNDSSRICIYDKQKQYISSKESKSNIQAAANILRIEIRPSRYISKQYDKTRSAVKLLTKQYASYISDKYHLDDIMAQINKRNRTKQPTPLSPSNIKNIETAAGFMYLLDTYGERRVKETMTPSTFKNRKKLLKKINI
ncbi:hypothetical protein, partial [Bacillus mobilis]